MTISTNSRVSFTRSIVYEGTVLGHTGGYYIVGLDPGVTYGADKDTAVLVKEDEVKFIHGPQGERLWFRKLLYPCPVVDDIRSWETKDGVLKVSHDVRDSRWMGTCLAFGVTYTTMWRSSEKDAKDVMWNYLLRCKEDLKILLGDLGR